MAIFATPGLAVGASGILNGIDSKLQDLVEQSKKLNDHSVESKDLLKAILLGIEIITEEGKLLSDSGGN